MTQRSVFEIKFQEKTRKWNIDIKPEGLKLIDELTLEDQIFKSMNDLKFPIITVSLFQKNSIYIFCLSEQIYLIPQPKYQDFFKTTENQISISNKNIYFCSIESYENFFSDTKIINKGEFSPNKDKIRIFSDEIKNFLENSVNDISFNPPNQHWEISIESIIGYIIQESYFNTKLNRNQRNIKYNANHYITIYNFISQTNFITLNYNLLEKDLFVMKQNINSQIREIENYEKLKIHHPYRSKYFGKLNENNLLLEYIDGETLQNYKLNELTNTEKKSIIFNIMISIEDVHLSYLMYRDLKPTNIIINDNKEAVLIDFDSSRKMEQTSIEFSSNIGEDGFISPEQNTSRKYSFETDIYSIGSIIYFIITGNKYEFNSDFPKDFKFIEPMFNKCIEKKASKRPNISELINIFYETIFSNFESTILHDEKIKNTLIELAKIRIVQLQYFFEEEEQDSKNKIIKNIFEVFNFLMFFAFQDYDKEMRDILPKIEKLATIYNDASYLTLLCLKVAYEDGKYVNQDQKKVDYYTQLLVNKRKTDENENKYIYECHLKQERLLNQQRSQNSHVNSLQLNPPTLSQIPSNQTYQIQNQQLNNYSQFQNQIQMQPQAKSQPLIQPPVLYQSQNFSNSSIINQQIYSNQQPTQVSLQPQNLSSFQFGSQQPFNAQNQQLLRAKSNPQFQTQIQNNLQYNFPLSDQNYNEQQSNHVQSQPQFQNQIQPLIGNESSSQMFIQNNQQFYMQNQQQNHYNKQIPQIYQQQYQENKQFAQINQQQIQRQLPISQNNTPLSSSQPITQNSSNQYPNQPITQNSFNQNQNQPINQINTNQYSNQPINQINTNQYSNQPINQINTNQYSNQPINQINTNQNQPINQTNTNQYPSQPAFQINANQISSQPSTLTNIPQFPYQSTTPQAQIPFQDQFYQSQFTTPDLNMHPIIQPDLLQLKSYGIDE